MPTQTLKTPLGERVPYEVHPAWSRRTVVIAAGLAVVQMTVLAKVAGKYQPVNFSGNGDAKVAVAVALEDVDTAAGEKKSVVLVRGAVVDIDALVWPAGATDEQKANALEYLDALGIAAQATL